MYVRYIYKLCDLHLASANHTEAAFTLLLHADLLDWTDSMLPPAPAPAGGTDYPAPSGGTDAPAPPRGGTDFPAQAEWQRKEALYMKIINEFDKGKVSGGHFGSVYILVERRRDFRFCRWCVCKIEAIEEV